MHRAGIYPAITGQCYKGAIKLADQYANRTSTTYYNYYRKYNNYYNGLNCRDTTGVALDTALEDEDWDWIIFQQQSDESGQYASFVSGGFDINTFVSYVKTKCPNAKIAIVAPWTHANGFTGSDFMTYYGGSVAAQDAAIKTTIPQVADHMSQCDLIIDLNRLVDVARQNSYLGALGTEMLMSDKNHIDPGIPTYMCGIYMAMCLGADAGSVFWYPTISEDPNITSATNSFLAWLARQCAKNTFNSFDV